jgi:hypothetical protein
MNEKTLLIALIFLIIGLFSLNFNRKWNDMNYEKIKNKSYSWYWFRLFKVPETRENYAKFNRGLSFFVITILIIVGILIWIF